MRPHLHDFSHREEERAIRDVIQAALRGHEPYLAALNTSKETLQRVKTCYTRVARCKTVASGEGTPLAKLHSDHHQHSLSEHDKQLVTLVRETLRFRTASHWVAAARKDPVDAAKLDAFVDRWLLHRAREGADLNRWTEATPLSVGSFHTPTLDGSQLYSHHATGECEKVRALKAELYAFLMGNAVDAPSDAAVFGKHLKQLLAAVRCRDVFGLRTYFGTMEMLLWFVRSPGRLQDPFLELRLEARSHPDQHHHCADDTDHTAPIGHAAYAHTPDWHEVSVAEHMAEHTAAHPFHGIDRHRAETPAFRRRWRERAETVAADVERCTITAIVDQFGKIVRGLRGPDLLDLAATECFHAYAHDFRRFLQHQFEAERRAMLAIFRGSMESAHIVVPRMVEWADASGYNLLHHAAAGGARPLVAVLLQKAPRMRRHIGAQNRVGQTPLHIAAAGGQQQIVALFLQHGAPLDVVDIVGRTAVETAAAAGHDTVVELIESVARERRVTAAVTEAQRRPSACNQILQRLRGHFDAGDAAPVTPATPALVISSEALGNVANFKLDTQSGGASSLRHILKPRATQAIDVAPSMDLFADDTKAWSDGSVSPRAGEEEVHRMLDDPTDRVVAQDLPTRRARTDQQVLPINSEPIQQDCGARHSRTHTHMSPPSLSSSVGCSDPTQRTPSSDSNNASARWAELSGLQDAYPAKPSNQRPRHVDPTKDRNHGHRINEVVVELDALHTSPTYPSTSSTKAAPCQRGPMPCRPHPKTAAAPIIIASRRR